MHTMRKCCKNTKSNQRHLGFSVLTVLMMILPWQLLQAAPVAMVTALKGRAFVFHEGKTSTLSTGDSIEDFSEVLIEEGAQISMADYFDHRYHISGSGHVRFMRRLIDLKRGSLWVQTLTPGQSGQVQTANARADHDGAEFMISFDPATGKTQMLTVEGMVQFANLLEEDFVMMVKEGQFSFIDKEYENGRPRTATEIGQQSFKKLLSLYPGIFPLKGEYYLFPKETTAQLGGDKIERAVASVETPVAVAPRAPATSGDEGSFIYRKLPEKIEVKNFDVDGFHKSKLEVIRKNTPVKKWAPSYDRPSKLKINIFQAGSTHKSVKKAPAPDASKRAPASLVGKASGAMVNEINPQVIIPDNNFESELSHEYKRQMRHSNEVNRLIEDLKNYESDYQIRH